MPADTKHKIELARAEKVANIITTALQPHCSQVKVAGSIRRRRPWVHDIDIVLIPSNAWAFYEELVKLNGGRKPKPDGPKIKNIQYGDIPVDIYIADEKIWATLLLIRTGSAGNNIRLCTRAQELKWKLTADGSGLFNQYGKRIAGDTEQSIYESLGLPYQAPDERD